jgi:hypothetical protein
MKHNRVVIGGAAALAVLAGGAAAGAAVTASPIDGAGVIHGCYYRASAGGSHRIVLQDAGRRCPRHTTGISWNRVGPQGIPGPQGQQGIQGVQGLPGKSGVSHLYTYVRTFAEGTGPGIAPFRSNPQPVGSLSLPQGSYLVDATVDVENTANFLFQNNSRQISCTLAPAPDTGHLFVNGADTDGNRATLTMTAALGSATSVAFNCVSLTGGTDQSHVLVTSVRINAVALDTISSE